MLLRAVVDSNIFIAALATAFTNGASLRVFTEIFNGGFRLVSSRQAIDELHSVLKLPDVKLLHELNDSEIDNLCARLTALSDMIDAPEFVSRAMPRDITDAKFLDLALAADADFLVTNDRRHLLPLKKIGRTKIVTPHKFLMALKRR